MEKYDFQEGRIILINKPLRWTSFDAVNKIRFILKHRFGYSSLKIGHAGTLDPLATGLLIICTGKKTKEIASLQEHDKEYEARIVFGKTTPSFDLETQFDREYPAEHITRELIEEKIQEFRGSILQEPPLHSARHINGKRAYDLARKGKIKTLSPHQVTIHAIELRQFVFPEATLYVKCSKGTYIRSLARDLGRACGSGAYLSGLVRIAIGPYRLENAMTIEDFEKSICNFETF
ncbi:MAG TPA: tRNA pseudouridine(55) synthase TruB [Bacteroidales bacterium]|nr:tRNA pseudouridine(55) synthase TruB [Bacteroidales bacterium]HQK36937.1 tRNA pseudouridine(55) synthase TruB [Bacteroidales bacterium]